jgi:hypothetical protein
VFENMAVNVDGEMSEIEVLLDTKSEGRAGVFKVTC